MKIGLLILSLLLLPPLARAEEKDPCKQGSGLFAELVNYVWPGTAPAKSPVYAEAEKAIDEKFAVKIFETKASRAGWIEWKELSQKQRDLLESLPRLTPEERAELLARVREAKPEDVAARRFRQLMLMGLYDRSTWGNITTAIYEDNNFSHLAMAYLPSIEKGLPEDIRQGFLEALGDRYFSFGKDRERYAELAPKRLADWFMKRVLKGDELIESELAKGASAADAYRAYISRVQGLIPNEGLYTANHTLEILEKVRVALRERMMQGPFGNRGAEPELWVGGSVPNGRGTFLESDLDIGTNVELPADLQAAIGEVVQKHAYGISPSAQLETAIKEGLELEFWTKRHPVAFRIRPSRIELVVASPDGTLKFHRIKLD